MNQVKTLGKHYVLMLVIVLITACGGDGNEYQGSAPGVTLNTPNKFMTFSNPQFDQTEYATAYYKAIDPSSARDTLQKFITLNEFDTSGPDAHVTFRDTKDLGYGRNIYMRSYPNPSACGGQMLAIYAHNFVVKFGGGLAYGPVNLDAVVHNDQQHHFGTNAIEFGYGNANVGDTCSAEPLLKFFTYRADYTTPGAPHPRLLRVNLDGRGEKAAPQPCVNCHGGTLQPLDRHGRMVTIHANNANDPGVLSDVGSTKARLNALEVDTFEFSDKAGFRRVDLEEDFRKINNAIFCSYPGSAPPTTPASVCAGYGGGIDSSNRGEWSGDLSRDMILGWYSNTLETAGSSFDGSYVPPGWRPSVGGPPVGADTLFTRVVAPNCTTPCHGKRGTGLGSDSDPTAQGKDLNFSTWDKFISYADEIERRVYDEGNMPFGLPNYLGFWADPAKPELLASFIAVHVTDPTSFNDRRIDAQGNIIQPGRVITRAGLDRVTKPGASITLNAQASLFANDFSWQLLSSPPLSKVLISTPDEIATEFSADIEGEYVVRLTTKNTSNGTSGSDEITVRVDATLAKAPRDLKFYDDIVTRLTTCANNCHSSGGGTHGGVVDNISTWYVADAQQPSGIPLSIADPPALGLYEGILARINFERIKDSLILQNPSGLHHYGGARSGFDTSLAVGVGGRSDYDMFVNWIAEGVICGGTSDECP